MTASKIFLYFCLSFVGGIFVSSIFNFSQLVLLGLLILGIILISVFWPFGKLRVKNTGMETGILEEKKKIVVVGFCILFLVLGIWRHQEANLQITNNKLQILNDQEETVTLVGIVSEEPDIGDRSIKLKIKNEKVKINEQLIDVSGKVLVTTRRYPEYRYGDKLKITGNLKTPSEDIQGFNYKDYLKKDGIYSVMDWPKIEKVGNGFGNHLMEKIFSFKNKFKSATRQFVSPPQEGILEALVFGDESNIPQNLKDKLNLTGTRHITAVSGMNITIIASLILSFLLLWGFWRNQAFYLSIAILILYILMIGAPASAVRAGIMAGLFLLAQNLGRMSMASRAIVFASTVMLALNPLLLKLDVGFQLSFLAILGMVYLQPLFTDWLKKLPNPKIFPVRTTLSATLSAQIFTLPILIYNFGYISLISPLVNILIVPFLAPITILIFAFGFAVIIFLPSGYIFYLPVWLALTYITGLIDFFSQISFAQIKLSNLHWLWLFTFYFILGLATWRLNKNYKLKFLNY